VHYFSIPDFDQEPGTDFPSFEAVIDAVRDVLPAVNTSEERTRAREELNERMRDSDDTPN
jgi:hypothetical protein